MIKELTIAAAAACLFAGCGKPANKAEVDQKTNLKFADATERSGVRFKHVPTRTENKWIPEIMGAGVAVADFNRDGAPDIVLVNSGALGEKTRPDAAKDRLYINDGKGNFSDKTDEWNLTSTGYGMGAAVGDFDNDGWTDLFLTTFEGDNRLLRNTGAKFEDVTERSGIKSDGRWATSAAFLDIDADGRLDLYVARYINFDTASAKKTFHNRLLVYPTPLLYEAVSDEIWRNIGGKFENASRASGIAEGLGKGLALAIADIDVDGDQDIYVANDTEANQLWINDGKGSFKDIAQLSGSAYSHVGKAQGSMGVDLSDVDNNNRLDIAVTNFQEEETSIYSQTGPLLFSEISDAIGIGQSSRARLKFGIDFFDADNDGDEDLLVANGHIEDNIEQNSDSVKFAQPNSLYENLGNGRFTDVSEAAGGALADAQVSRGLATADLNGDGLLDYIVSNNGGTAQIGFNESSEAGNFVILWLEGETANRNAIGARVTAKIGDKTIDRQTMGAQSYLSVSDFRLHLGLGKNEKIAELTIHWPGGEVQTVRDVAGGKFYYLKQGNGLIEFRPGEKTIR